MSDAEITRTALRVIAHLSVVETQRFAAVAPDDIAIAVSAASAPRWNERALARLRMEISRLCRLQADAA
jgi:hypothetical protein